MSPKRAPDPNSKGFTPTVLNFCRQLGVLTGLLRLNSLIDKFKLFPGHHLACEPNAAITSSVGLERFGSPPDAVAPESIRRLQDFKYHR